MKRPSPAMVIATVALFVALGGTGYAASSNGVTARKNADHSRHKKGKVVLVRGPRGTQGPRGLQGPPGPSGTNGQQGSPGTARAYAYIVPHKAHCGGCDEQPAGSETAPVIEPARSLNVALGTLSGSASGVWCFTLGAGINPTTATLVVSPITGPFVQVAALWIPGAGACSSTNEVEIQTFGYEIQAGKLEAVPNNEIAFSFIVG
jgi:hypothetical protein